MLVEGRMWPWEVVEGLTFLYGRLQHYNHCSSFNVPNVFFFRAWVIPHKTRRLQDNANHLQEAAHEEEAALVAKGNMFVPAQIPVYGEL